MILIADFRYAKLLLLFALMPIFHSYLHDRTSTGEGYLELLSNELIPAGCHISKGLTRIFQQISRSRRIGRSQ